MNATKRLPISTNTLIRIAAVIAIVVAVMVMANKMRARVGEVTPAIAAESTMTDVDRCIAIAQPGAPSSYSNGQCFILRDGSWQEVKQ